MLTAKQLVKAAEEIDGPVRVRVKPAFRSLPPFEGILVDWNVSGSGIHTIDLKNVTYGTGRKKKLHFACYSSTKKFLIINEDEE